MDALRWGLGESGGERAVGSEWAIGWITGEEGSMDVDSGCKRRRDRVEKVNVWNVLMGDNNDGMWMGGRCGETGGG